MPTRVAAINSSKLLIAISNGASPEVFSHPCMINTNRGIAFTSNPTEVLIPYCPPDEDLAGWIEREGDGLSATVTGAGVFDAVLLDIELFHDWFTLQLSKHIHVIIDTRGYWDGNFLCTAFSENGPGRRQKVEFDGTFMSDGPLSWHATT
jgi:hypothetical protein